MEKEHKYLVINDEYKEMATDRLKIRQGYLNRNPDRTVRIRIIGQRGYLTVKGINQGDKRLEYEYEIPEKEAQEILNLAEPGIVEKTRYLIPYKGHVWEVDEFHGSLEGCVIAEVELAENEKEYEIPPFIGKNITGDPKYYNSNLKV
ncbi:MAG: CYTH domain-containing protein [Muribaculaceae bacterium]|nr:CYTH domain-containing protein [Muribaculaceae bacterium]